MSDPSSINYEPLLALNHLWQKTFVRSLRGSSLIVTTLLLIIALGAGFAGIFQPLFFFIVFYPFFLIFRANTYKNRVWIEFAAANNWPLDTTTSVQTLIPPSLQYGHSPGFSPIIRAQLGAVASDLYMYQYLTGSGRSQMTHIFTVAQVGLAKALPHIMLFSKKVGADVHLNLANHEILPLEGDFDNYFSLFVEKGQEIDVLAIIAPDVMQCLVDYDRAEDVEIWGSNMYFIMRSDRRDYQDTQQLITSVVELTAQIAEHIRLTTVSGGPDTSGPAATPAPPPNVVVPPLTPAVPAAR